LQKRYNEAIKTVFLKVIAIFVQYLIYLKKSYMNEIIKKIGLDYAPERAKLPHFQAGDTINVHIKITEGKKDRIQQFQGVVLQRRHPNTNGETFTIRKISEGVGVERIFPLLSPSIEKVEVKQQGKVRRARLYHLKYKKGKEARIKSKATMVEK
jgi:large subunit ribosomal protein L19